MRRLLVASALLLHATPALAVPVGTSADTRTAAPQHRQAWKQGGVQLKLDGSFLAGNVNLTNLSVNLAANYNDGPHQLFLDAGDLYTATPSATLIDRLAGSSLYAYALRDNVNLYGYVTGAHDASSKLDSRLTAGLGGCVHRLFVDEFSLFLISLNPAYELENALGGQTQTWRAVARLNVIKPMSDTVELGLDAFYTPAVADPADLRVYGEAYARVKLAGDALAVRFTVADEYDTRPQPGIQLNDVGVFTSIEAAWGR
ncbi:MAG: hypothetical protein JWM80_5615 [Cyanobacteria bacterium RYN_339]|nr:hypothetical protein [Cyanobacteria bacterium RYN_339]